LEGSIKGKRILRKMKRKDLSFTLKEFKIAKKNDYTKKLSSYSKAYNAFLQVTQECWKAKESREFNSPPSPHTAVVYEDRKKIRIHWILFGIFLDFHFNNPIHNVHMPFWMGSLK
jgi:hypothetical protein